MLKTRNQRIKTDYNQYHPNKIKSNINIKKTISHINCKQKLSTIQPKQTFLSRILHSINNQVSYEKLTDNEIRIESDILKQKVRDLNSMIQKLLNRQLQRKSSAQRISNKATIIKEMGINHSSLSQQYVLNIHVISKLNQEYLQNNKKLQLLSNPDVQMNYEKKKTELLTQCKFLKEQIGRMKKNKNLRQKQIMKCSSEDNQELEKLRCEYVTLSRKSQITGQRLKNSQKDLMDIQFSLMKQREIYQQLREDYSNIIQEEQSLKDSFNQQHLTNSYSNKMRKLQLISKRLQRDEQNKKRKYYNLLLQFQALKERETKISQDLMIASSQYQRQLQYIQQLLREINEGKSKSKSTLLRPFQNKRTHDGDSSFFITNLTNKDKDNTTILKQTTFENNQPQKNIGQWASQKKFNQSNIYIKNSQIRRWTKPIEIKQRLEINQTKFNLRNSNYQTQSNQQFKIHLKEKLKILKLKTDSNKPQSPYKGTIFNELNEVNEFIEKDSQN